MRLQKKASKPQFGARKQSKKRPVPAETVSPQPDSEWIARALDDAKHNRLSPNNLIQLQRVIGNQAVNRLIAPNQQDLRLQRTPLPISANGGLSAVVQLWPEDTGEQPEKSSIAGTFKCHDAVVFWLLRSLNYDREAAIKALNLVNKKRGNSGTWVPTALNYQAGTRINGPDEIGAGDILFLPNKESPAHSMVSIGNGQVKGFNNAGTFGTVDGDTYSIENIGDPGFWFGKEGNRRLGPKPDFGFDIPDNERMGFPVFKIGFGIAQNALKSYVPTVKKWQRNYSTKSMDVKKKGCYITTAVTLTRGLSDDCEELTTLRAFRDDYLLAKPNGRQLVELYYQYAPDILDAIARRRDAVTIYRSLYDVIRSCVDAIKQGDNEFAYRTYCRMVIRLQEEYLPDAPLPAYQI